MLKNRSVPTDVLLPHISPDGANPEAGLVRDSSGNLYGTTTSGGEYSYGTIFKLTSGGTESVLHSFAGYPSDGEYPLYEA